MQCAQACGTDASMSSTNAQLHGPQPGVHQLTRENMDAIQGFLLNMQQQKQQQQCKLVQSAPRTASGRPAFLPDLNTEIHQEFPANPAVSPSHNQPKPSGQSFPCSPTLASIDPVLLWPGVTSPTALEEADMSHAAWEDATRFETPICQSAMPELFSPSPARRPSISLTALQMQGLPNVSNQNNLPGAPRLPSSVVAEQAQSVPPAVPLSQDSSAVTQLRIRPIAEPDMGNLRAAATSRDLPDPASPNKTLKPDATKDQDACYLSGMARLPALSMPSLPYDPALLLRNLIASNNAQMILEASQHARNKGAILRMSEDLTPPRDREAANSKKSSRRRGGQNASDSETSMEGTALRAASSGSRGSRAAQRADARSGRTAGRGAASQPSPVMDLSLGLSSGPGSLQSPPEVMMQLATNANSALAAAAVSRHMGSTGPPPQPRTCHCKKSQCLKLYCDCFAAGVYCVSCACVECYNRPEYALRVAERRDHIMQRDPKAFTLKILRDNSQQTRHKKGCNCKRSHCLKKYCECYQGGVKCSDACKCQDCHNQDDPNHPSMPPLGPSMPFTLGMSVPFKTLDMSNGLSTPKGVRGPMTHLKTLDLQQAGNTLCMPGDDAGRRATPSTLQYPHSTHLEVSIGTAGMGASTGSSSERATAPSLALQQQQREADAPVARRRRDSVVAIPVKVEPDLATLVDEASQHPMGIIDVPPRVSTPTQFKSAGPGNPAATGNPVATAAGTSGVPLPFEGREPIEREGQAGVRETLSTSGGVPAAGGGGGIQGCPGLHTSEELMSPTAGGSLTARILTGNLFGSSMLGLGSPGSLPLDTLMGASNEDGGGGSALWHSPWRPLAPFEQSKPDGSSARDSLQWKPNSADECAARLVGALQWLPTSGCIAEQSSAMVLPNSAEKGASGTNSPFSPEANCLLALVSPVRTQMKRTVGIKRSHTPRGKSHGGAASGAADALDLDTQHQQAPFGAVPTSPALDALASVAVAERRGAGLLSDGGVLRSDVLLLPQSPSKRTALGSGSQPSRSAVGRNPCLPPLSLRQVAAPVLPPLQTLQHQASVKEAVLPDMSSISAATSTRTRVQPALSGPTHSQSSVGSPARASSGVPAGPPAAASSAALKAQANDYIAARTRRAGTPTLPPPGVSGGGSAGGGAGLQTSTPAAAAGLQSGGLSGGDGTTATSSLPLPPPGIPVPPPSHPVPGIHCRTLSMTSAASFPLPPSLAPQKQIGAAELPPLDPASLAREQGSNSSVPRNGLEGGGGGPCSDRMTATGLACDGQINAVDMLQSLGPAHAVSMLCSTPWSDAAGVGDGADKLDSMYMSPMGGAWDPSLLLMSPRLATPLYAKVGANALNSPLFSMSPTRWWSGVAGGGNSGSLGLLGPGPMSVSASPLRAAVKTGGGAPSSDALAPSGCAEEGASGSASAAGVQGCDGVAHVSVHQPASVATGGSSPSDVPAHAAAVGSGQLLKMTPGTTVLSPIRPSAGHYSNLTTRCSAPAATQPEGSLSRNTSTMATIATGGANCDSEDQNTDLISVFFNTRAAHCGQVPRTSH